MAAPQRSGMSERLLVQAHAHFAAHYEAQILEHYRRLGQDVEVVNGSTDIWDAMESIVMDVVVDGIPRKLTAFTEGRDIDFGLEIVLFD